MTSTTAPAIRLTANETAILKAFPTFQFASDYRIDDLDHMSIWTWSFSEDAAAAAGISTRAVRGVITSLVKKGLVTCENDGPADERTITITDAGLALVVALQDPAPAAKPNPVELLEATQDDDAIIALLDATFAEDDDEPEACQVCAIDSECGRHHPNHNETDDETTPEQPEVAVSEPVAVVWPERVAKLFFRALGRDGADILATAYGLTRQANQTRLTLTISGDPEKAAWLADSLPTLFEDANESLKQWRKTSPNYKRHSLATTEGRRDAYAAEQDYLRGFCWAVAGTFTQDMLASDGVQAGLAYINKGE